MGQSISRRCCNDLFCRPPNRKAQITIATGPSGRKSRRIGSVYHGNRVPAVSGADTLAPLIERIEMTFGFQGIWTEDSKLVEVIDIKIFDKL